MKHDYLLGSPEPGIRGRTVAQYDSDRGREHLTAMLWLPEGTPSETMGEVLDALRRAYAQGREDLAAELIPDDQPAGFLRRIMRDEAVSAIGQWAVGYTEPVDGNRPRQHYITLEGADEANSTLDMSIGAERYTPLKRFRVRVLVEEIEQR